VADLITDAVKNDYMDRRHGPIDGGLTMRIADPSL